jgi:ribokinase
MSLVIDAVTAAPALQLIAVVNPAPAQPLPPELLRAAPILLPNEGEALALAGEDGLDEAIARLQQLGVEEMAVTRGASGVTVLSGGQRAEIAAIATDRAVDTTGAGDTFAGVAAAWMAGGAPLPDAARAGNAAASLSVRSTGARTGMPLRDAIEGLLSLP